MPVGCANRPAVMPRPRSIEENRAAPDSLAGLNVQIQSVPPMLVGGRHAVLGDGPIGAVLEACVAFVADLVHPRKLAEAQT